MKTLTTSAQGTYVFEVAEKCRVSPTVVKLVLVSTERDVMRYAEGQFLSILLPGGQSRCYSMAGADTGDGRVELHVRVHQGGLFSDRLLGTLHPGAHVQAVGPFGACVWRPWNGSAVLVATGTGIAPLKAIVDRLAIDGHTAPVHLYWGVREEAELYLADHFAALQARLRNLRFVPVLAEGPLRLSARRGFVQDVAAEDFTSLADAKVYACGVPAMVDAARALFVERLALPPGLFHADPFNPPVERRERSWETVKVTVQNPAGGEVEIAAPVGATLLEALKAAGISILSVCGGKAACGTCRVRLLGGAPASLPPPDRNEVRLLAALDNPTCDDRLACQVIIAPRLDGLAVALD